MFLIDIYTIIVTFTVSMAISLVLIPTIRDSRMSAPRPPGSSAIRIALSGLFFLVAIGCPVSVSAGQHDDQEFRIYSGEEPIEEAWTIWSRNDLLDIGFSTDAKIGDRSLRIKYPDVEPLWREDWLLYNKINYVDVKPGEEWTVSAWVKFENTTRVGIEILAFADDEQISNWRGGYAATYGTGDWEYLEASAVMPPGARQVRMRVGGSGRSLVWVDDIRVRRGLAKRKTPPRPQVEGWAFGGERVEQKLDRGLDAMVLEDESVYLKWRLLKSDSQDVAFNIYRSAGHGDPEQLNQTPVSITTDYIDDSADLSVENVYYVRPVTDGVEGNLTGRFRIGADPDIKPYRSIALEGDETTFQKVGIGDLNGDGKMDFVIKTPNTNVDPYHPPTHWRASETTYKLEAYLSDGTFLWRKDLGWNIETGIWYSPYVVYDLNGNGRAEVAVKTGPEKDYRQTEHGEHDLYGPGRVMTGPEYLTILDGMTGEKIAQTDWPSRDGHGAYNYYSRNMLGIAYLDGKTPAVVISRGTYTIIKLETWQLLDGELDQLWAWESSDEPGGLYYAQGDHYLHTADLNGDGRDAVVIGAAVVNSNGDGLWTSGLSHVDNAWVGNIDPTRPGLEIYYGVEGTRAGMGSNENGMSLWDAETGEMLWGFDQRTHHIHGTGLCSNIDYRHIGMECYSGEQNRPDRWVHNAKGELIADESVFSVGLSPRAVHWDARPEREVLVGSSIFRFPDDTIADYIEGRQVAWADLFGDWREEIITSVPGELRIYSTPIPAEDRRITLLQDPLYRSGVAHLSMGYGQPPLTSYYIGRQEGLTANPPGSNRNSRYPSANIPCCREFKED